jgi:hypothetical protein
MRDAGADIARLPKLGELLGWLRKKPAASDKELQELSRESATTVEGQLRLANAFGLVVRIGNHSWFAPPTNDTDADEIVFESIRRAVRDEPNVQAANIAGVFLSLLPRKGQAASGVLSLPTFRSAVFRLLEQRRIRLSGGSPESSAAKVRALVHDAKGMPESREIDLGRGDFLVPGTPCVVATLQESGR